jgi:hypothetical protein
MTLRQLSTGIFRFQVIPGTIFLPEVAIYRNGRPSAWHPRHSVVVQEWGRMASDGIFLGARRQLGNQRPLDLLRQGTVNEAVAHAGLHATENTW